MVDNIEEAKIIDETNGLSGSGGAGDFFQKVVAGIDNLTEGQRGKIATNALILSGYATNPVRLREVYRNNSKAIDQWFENVDLQRLLNDTDATKSVEDGIAGFVKEKGVPVLIGVSAGILIASKVSK